MPSIYLTEKGEEKVGKSEIVADEIQYKEQYIIAKTSYGSTYILNSDDIKEIEAL